MSKREAVVSVIVPTRNSAPTLERCLASIRSQTHSPVELIVVDNQSSDSTPEIARRYCDIVETRGPERSSQRNHGARVAHGRYLLFIDSDMELSQSVVADCLKVIRDTNAPAVIVPEISIGDGFLARCRAFERSFYAGDDSIEGARFFDRLAFERVGGYDEKLIALEDWDLSARVAAAQRLPRTDSVIAHNEGRLRLTTLLAKKRYYASSAIHYVRKHGGPAVRQGNIVFRPAFLRNWNRLLRHPVLTLGVLSIKSLEAGAVAWGIIAGPGKKQDSSGQSIPA